MTKQNKTYWKYLAIAVGALVMFYVAPVAADGQKVYKSACKACHGTGVIGAPKFGDKAAWADRISQGMDTLNDHAIKGFKGKKGMMPPKGGKKTLSDDDVKAAVAHMVAAVK